MDRYEKFIPSPEKTILIQAHIPVSLHKRVLPLKRRVGLDWDGMVTALLNEYVIIRGKAPQKSRSSETSRGRSSKSARGTNEHARH